MLTDAEEKRMLQRVAALMWEGKQFEEAKAQAQNERHVHVTSNTSPQPPPSSDQSPLKSLGMVKFIWLAFAIFVVIAIVKDMGGIEGWIDPAKPQVKGPLITCSKLASNSEIANCMANNCVFDRPELNAPHCNAR